jgi:DNA invertase Pin-like site-specific DNA recombinase
MMAVKNQVSTGVRPVKKRSSPIGNAKLNNDLVREIKLMLADKETMTRFGSRQQAYEEIARAYKVSHHTISNIHKGLAWRQVKL